MIRFPCPLHAPQDDLAPRDYSYVRSVSEGRRRAQLQNIHHEPAPEPPIARPQVDEYGIPDNPYLQQAPAMQPVRRSRAARNVTQPVVQPPEPTFAPQQQPAPQPQFAAPVSPEIPDWLRVAQQNNMPFKQRPQGPSVFAAPHQEEAPAVDALGRPLHRRMQTSPYAPPVRQNERQFIPCMLLAGEIERDNLPAQKLRSGLCGLHRAPHGRCIDPVEPIPGNPPADRLRLPEPKRRQGVRIITGIAVADKVQQHGITPFPFTVFILA